MLNKKDFLQIPNNIYSCIVKIIVKHDTYFEKHIFHNTYIPKETIATGFFINTNGHILTSLSNVEYSSQIHVEIPAYGKKQYRASIISICPEFNIAVLHIDKGDSVLTEHCVLDVHNHIQTGFHITVSGFMNESMHLKHIQGIISGQQHSQFETNIVSSIRMDGAPVFHQKQVIGIFHGQSNKMDNKTFTDEINYIVPITRYYAIQELVPSTKIIHFPSTFGIEYHKTYTEWLTFVGCNMKKIKTCEPFNRKLHTAKVKISTPHQSYSRRSSKTSLQNKQIIGGLHITKVHTGGLLYKTGIKKGDVLLKINDIPINCYGELALKWMNQKMSLRNLLYTLPLGHLVPIEYFSVAKKKCISTRFSMRQHILPTRHVYTSLEVLDYENIAGLTIMELCKNHLSHPSLPFRLHPSNIDLHVPHVVISNVYARSFVSSLQLLDDYPHILEKVNGKPVHTIDDFRKHIYKSIKRQNEKYITLLTSENILIVLPFHILMKEETSYSNHFKPTIKLSSIS